MASTDSNIIQKNGFIVMEALQALNEPATLQRVTNKIAEIHNINPGGIKDTVKSVLLTGVENGFLQRLMGRFSICGIEMSYLDSENEKYSDNEGADACCPPKRRRKPCCKKPPPCCRKPKPCCRKPPPCCRKPPPCCRKPRKCCPPPCP